MPGFSEMVAMAGEEGIGLGASFEGPRFAPTRAVWEGIASDVEEQLFVELAAHFLGTRLEQGFGDSSGTGEGTGKADSWDGDEMVAGAIQHQAADQIMNQQMHAQFPLHRAGTFAAEMLHLEGGLEVAKAQLHVPAAQEQCGQRIGGIALGIHQVGDQQDLLGTKAGPTHPATNQPEGQGVGELAPKSGFNSPGTARGFGPQNFAIMGTQTLTPTEIGPMGAAGPDDDVES